MMMAARLHFFMAAFLFPLFMATTSEDLAFKTEQQLDSELFVPVGPILTNEVAVEQSSIQVPLYELKSFVDIEMRGFQMAHM